MKDERASAVDLIDNLRKDRDDLHKSLISVAKVIKKYSDALQEDSSVRELRDITNEVAEDTKDMLEENRLLRLGVVGQVKAGKSSLLNLLLFGGEEVLPKAATPMTASLTHIVKSDREEIEIQYYSHNDWKEIKEHANEFRRANRENEEQIAPFVKASFELVEMVKKRSLSPKDYLGKKNTLAIPSSELNQQLRRLVGSEGEVTPLAKSVTIHSRQGVPDLEIVDTPGINDPISSRSEQAKKMLGRCDAILLLSYAGQFLDNVDVEFFSNSIPQEGIRHRLVICSKFDSALIDVSKDHKGNIDDAKEDTKQRLSDHAREAMDRLNNEIVFEELPESDIIFVSAMCAILSNKPPALWTSEERHVFGALQRAYPDFLDQPEDGQAVNEKTKDNLAWLGNRGAIDDHLQKVRKDKDSIMSQKIDNFLREKRSQAQEELEELINGLEEKRTAVRNTDIDKLKEQRKVVKEVEEELTSKVIDAWEELIEKGAGIFKEFRDQLEQQIKQAQVKIKNAVGHEEKSRTEKEKKPGILPFFSRLLGVGGTEEKQVSYTEIVIDRQALKAAVEDLVDWLEPQVAEKAGRIFDRPFTRDATNQIRRIVADEFSNQLASKTDMAAVKHSVRESVAQITKQAHKSLKGHRLPALSYDIEASEAKSRKAVSEIAKVCRAWLAECQEKVDKVAEQAKTDLVPATVQQLQDYLNQLEKDIEYREFTLERFSLAAKELKKCRQELQSEGP